ncbi:MAG: aldehyde dehydrogenase family protein [Thermoplasmata archaeon]|nr:aldehyde dehydrogenase family protein [Thermoplasmata archaeon]
MSEIIMTNPATGEKLGVKKCWTRKQILDAYKKAREKAESFKNTTIEQRIEEVRKIKRYIVENMEEIAEKISKDLGKIKSEALLMEIFPVLDCISYYEKNAKKILKDKKVRNPISLIGKKSYVFYEPLGVILVIAPWNYPFNLSFIPIISAIIAGNVVIYKPSELATYTGMLIEEILEKSGFEKGVVTVVYGRGGEIGDALIEGKPDKIFLTGSTTTGRIIMEKAAKYLIPVELELGGKDPMIVFEDVNLERATNAAVWGSLLNSGQACVAIERIYVQENVYDDFVKLVVEKVKKLRQGWNGDYDIGSMTSPDQIKIVEDHIKDAVKKGAKILVGGKRKGKSMFFPPTVLVNVNHKMKIMKEETFGPVICIMKFKDEKEAVKLANDTIYGLNASVWSDDIDRAVRIARQIKCGGVAINNALTASANFALPFGGTKQSGMGRYHGPYGLYAFSNIKAVMIEKGKKETEINWYPFGKEKYERFLTTFKSLFSEKTVDKIKGLPAMIKLMRNK